MPAAVMLCCRPLPAALLGNLLSTPKPLSRCLVDAHLQVLLTVLVLPRKLPLALGGLCLSTVTLDNNSPAQSLSPDKREGAASRGKEAHDHPAGFRTQF